MRRLRDDAGFLASLHRSDKKRQQTALIGALYMIERKQQRSANEDAYLKAMRTYQALDAAALSPNENGVAK